MPFVLAKTSRCYQGGPGRRDVEYDTIKEAAQGAVDDGNPVGFDVYIKMPPRSGVQDPVMVWQAIREFIPDSE